MKKLGYVLLGVMAGIFLSITVSVSAEQISMIGKKVDDQAVIVMDGNELSIPAIILEGTSYAPVRAIGEAVGKEVGWTEGKITLDSKTTDELKAQMEKNIADMQKRSEDILRKQEVRKQIDELGKANEPLGNVMLAFEKHDGYLYAENRTVTEEEYQKAKDQFETNLKLIKELDEILKTITP